MTVRFFACLCACFGLVRLIPPNPNHSRRYSLTLTTAAFRPQSEQQLQDAVNECMKISPIGDSSEWKHGSIGDWDVSGVTEMGKIFSHASAFNQDLSKWDVSAVTGMGSMFHGASAFKRELCGVAWVNSKAGKSDMFTESPGLISSTVCTTMARPGDVYGYG